MSSAHESLSHNDAERLLASLAGIVSAHVVTDSIGRILEIHILSAAEVHPKQVVRNVESALTAGLGIEIDRRIVSVAQIRTPAGEKTARAIGEERSPGDSAANGNGRPAVRGDAAEATPEDERAPDQGRLQYVRFEARRDVERCHCEVVLRDGREEIVGSGSGPDTAAGRAEAAARAVLAGIEKARPDLRLELEGAAISASRGRSYVIVSARLLRDRMALPLAGAAPLTRSPEEAGILAALQATNRWSG